MTRQMVWTLLTFSLLLIPKFSSPHPTVTCPKMDSRRRLICTYLLNIKIMWQYYLGCWLCYIYINYLLSRANQKNFPLAQTIILLVSGQVGIGFFLPYRYVRFFVFIWGL